MSDRIMLRLTIQDPVAGLTYSLQDAKSAPVERAIAADEKGAHV